MAKGAIKAVIASQYDASGLNKAKKDISSFGKSLKGALGAVGLGIGISAISNQLEAMAKGAVEDAKSQAQLAIALKNTTNATDAQIAANEDFISKTALATNVLDSQLRPALASLVRITGDATQAQSLLQLSLDVSAGTGKDLEAVSKAIGKAYDGNTTALSRLVPGVQKGSGALADLQAKFKGAAAAAAANDPYGTLKIAFDQIGDTVGSILLPIIRDFAKWIADMTPGIVAFFNQLGDPTTEVGNAWLRMAGSIVEFGKIFLQTGTAVENANFLTFLFKAIGAIMRLAAETVWVFNEFGAAAEKLFKGDFSGWFNMQTTYWDRYNAFVDKLQKATAKPFTVTLPTGPNNPSNLPDIPSTKKATAANDALTKSVTAAKAAFEAKVKAYQEAVQAAQQVIDSTKEMTAGFVELFKVTPKMGEFESTVVDGFKGIFDTINNALDKKQILPKAAASLTAYANSSIAAMKAIAKQRDALAGKIDVARTITAGVTGLAQITGFLETTTESVITSTSTIANGIQTIVTKTADVTKTGGLIDNFQKVVDKTKAFAKNLIDLKKMGLNKNLFAQLVNAGADAGGATAQAIVDGGSKTVTALNDLYGQLDSAAADIAKTSTDTLYEVGQQVVTNGFIEGLVSQSDALAAAAEAMANSFASAFSSQLAAALQANLPAMPVAPPTSTDILSGRPDPNRSPQRYAAWLAGIGGIDPIRSPQSYAAQQKTYNITLQTGIVTSPAGLGAEMVAAISAYERASGTVYVKAI